MKKQTKKLILSIVVTLVLLLTFTITYAAFVYRQTGSNNQQLVLGDIYMHYNETNQLKMENAMPGGGLNKISTYTPNPIMANQEIVENELYECVNYLSKWSMAGKSLNDLLDNNSTVTSFCQGTGTLNGHTFQELLFAASNVEITEMLSLNIIQEDGGSYIVNPNIATQTINELSLCVSDFNSNVQLPIANMLDQGSTMETFCQGTGTASGVDINSWGTIFILQFKDTKLLDDNVFFKNDIYYTDVILNPIMQTEETGTGILGKCEVFFTNAPFDEGTTATSFCRGSGTSNGKTLLELSDDNDMVKSVLLSYELIMPKIDLPYFEFTISGKNTYSKKDIYYDIVLNHGDTPENRNTRIKDKFLKFKLTEVNEDNSETEIFSGKSYDTLENKRIHVETIPKNTMNKINKTYRLYMWIDENVVIGNVDEDYTTEEWNDVFASVKVNVSGDFFEKEVAYEDIYDVTDASCFTTEIVKSYQLNNNMTEEELAVCVDYFKDERFEDGSTPESFCKGTGSMYREQTFQYELDNYGYDESNLTYLEENNIVSSFDSVAISGYDETCGSDVVIPKTINGYSVTKIGLFNNKNLNSVVIPNSVRTIGGGAFEDNNLTSVVFEKNSKLTRIGKYAFKNNSLTSMLIPNSIIVIDNKAFNNNKLTSLTFEENSKVREIGDSAFRENLLINVEIPNSVTKWLHCNAFDNDVQIIKNENLSCFEVPQ